MTEVQIHLGDARALTMPDDSVDAIVCDPPYELGFMGKGWDASGVAYDTDMWRGCLRVLKPGGHLLAFGGTRTSHRMVVAIEDAGFEIRDSITWMYGSGFPKSLDVSKAIDKAAGAQRPDLGPGQWAYVKAGGTWNGSVYGAEPAHGEGPRTTAPATDDARQWAGWGTALKPASEPITVARKPFRGTVAVNVLANGTGALNIDGCRVSSGPPPAATGRGINGARSSYIASRRPTENVQAWDQPSGRWPANVVLSHVMAWDGADACAGTGCLPGCPVAALDEQSGDRPTGDRKPGTYANGRRGGIMGAHVETTSIRGFVGDSGGASRFFPTFRYQAKAPTKERPKADGVQHPCVKPLALMRWLVRLVTPPGGTVLDPFAGSGATIEAAILEGVNVIGVESHEPYLALIRERVARTSEATP